MTVEEAIKILSKDTSLEAVEELKYHAGFNRDKVIEQIQEAMTMGAEALKKQISKKPCSAEDNFMGYKRCPNCNKFFDADEEYYLKYSDWDYCGKCGQRIDWSE